MSRTNDDVARAFGELADLLELHGGERFRILSYRRAADVISSLERDVGTLSERELTSVRGVGKSVASKVREYTTTGTMKALEELRSDVPGGVVELTELPGLGPKRAMVLYRELGISSLEELQQAASEGRLREVAGFGPKVEENILRAMSEHAGGEQRIGVGTALEVAEELVEALRASDAVVRCDYAGSLRRMRETIGDVDLLAASDHPEEVMERFCALPAVLRVQSRGQTKSSIIAEGKLQVDLRVISPDVYGAALQYFTGSKAHNVKVREHAVRQGYKLSEYGLFETEANERVAGETEEEIYERLGMQWMPPTLREDKGEVEAALAHEIPRLVELADIRGDLQSHSTYSDGVATLRDMAYAAADHGYSYYAITDHGRRLGMRSMSVDDIERQRREVQELNRELGRRLTVLHGVELNIGKEGELDYPDEILERFDVVVASIHHYMDQPSAEITKRLVRAIEHPHVHIIGHPTGRRMPKRGPYEFDFATVCKAAARYDVALEVNASPQRLDLRDDHVRWAKDYGVRFVISTDAHSPANLAHIRYGVATAQRGWATPDEVINTWPLGRLRRFFAKGKRQRR